MVLLLTCLPCVIIWYGLYVLKNTVLTLELYHGVCLVPGIFWGFSLWRNDLIMPTLKQWLLLLVSAVIFSGAAVLLYDNLGYIFLDSRRVMSLLNELGFNKQHLIPLSLDLIFVNSALEELFWRGVILNRLDQMHTPFKHFGIISSSVMYAAFHYFILRLVVYPGWAEFGFILLAIYGAFLAIVYRKTGSIVMASLAHGFLTDLAAIVLILDLLQHYP